MHPKATGLFNEATMPKVQTIEPELYPEVDPEFSKLLPERSPEATADLEKELIEDGGPREPLVIWGSQNILLGGHTRYRICLAHNLPFTVIYKNFPNNTREEAMEWMIADQLKKRNLTDQERAYFIGKQYLMEKQKQGAPDKGATVAPLSPGSSQNKGKTAKKVAKKNKVGDRTVHRAAKFTAAVDAHDAANPGAKAKILAGGAGKGMSKVVKTAPILCPDCIRKGRMANCKKCEELVAKSKKRKPTADTLFKEPKAPKPPKPELDPYEILAKTGTAFATLATKLLKGTDERAQRLRDYWGWCGLTNYTNGVGQFLPWIGVKDLIEASGEKTRMNAAQTEARYIKSCNFLPPATKYRRAQRDQR